MQFPAEETMHFPAERSAKRRCAGSGYSRASYTAETTVTHGRSQFIQMQADLNRAR